MGVLTKPPALVKEVPAPFPPEALEAKLGGIVGLEIDIGADGKVTDARVVEPAGHGFDEAALEAVRQFEFSPAEVDGEPAAVRVSYRYEFFYRPEVVQTPPPEPEKVVNFSGRVLERGTRSPLAGATVTVGEGEGARELTTDAEGRFEAAGVPVGTQKVVVWLPDHERFETTEALKEGERTEVTYFVRRTLYSGYQTEVRGQRERKEVAQISLKQEEIRLIPGTQGDAFKVVQNLPGVARSPFSMGLLVVRGGKPWDTRTYVDDARVPLLFHFGGLNATFNSNLLEDINFQAGNFGAEYGRNIGGLVRGKTRTPAKDTLHGYVDVNVIDTSALVEAPLGENWSIAAGARRSYIDAVLPWVLDTFVPQADVLAFTVAPRFYDYQLKLERRRPNSRDRLTLSFFGSHDQVGFVLPNPALDPEGRGAFDTVIAYNRLGLTWDKGITDRLRFSSANWLGTEQFDFSAGSDIFFYGTSYPISSRQAFQLQVPEANLELAFGADLYLLPYRFRTQGPPRIKLNQIPDPFLSRQLISEQEASATFEPGLFIESVWKPHPKVKLVTGVRGDYESLMNDAWVDPRAALFVDVTQATTLKAAAGLYHQPPDYRQGQLSPVFGNPDLLPEAAAHYSAGVEQRLTQAVSLDLQVYYKSLFHQALPTAAPDVGAGADADTFDLNYTSDGRGRSYGVELLLRHQLTSRFFGWVAYSLSRTERLYSTGAYGLNPLDQPHNLIALASYKLPYDFIAGVRLRYASGALNTPYRGAIYDANGNYYFPLPGELFGRRLPAFFQADVRIDKRFVFEQWMLSVYADVQNVTNRANVEGVVYNFDYTQEQYVTGLPIIPAIGVRGEF